LRVGTDKLTDSTKKPKKKTEELERNMISDIGVQEQSIGHLLQALTEAGALQAADADMKSSYDICLVRTLRRWAIEHTVAAASNAGETRLEGGPTMALLRYSTPGGAVDELCRCSFALPGSLALQGRPGRKRAENKFGDRLASLGHCLRLLCGYGEQYLQSSATAEQENRSREETAVVASQPSREEILFSGIRLGMFGFSALESLKPGARQQAAQGLADARDGDTAALEVVVSNALTALLVTEENAEMGSIGVDPKALASLLRWQQPHLLLRYLAIHNNDPSVHRVAARLVRALLGAGEHGETFEKMRYNDPHNQAMLKYLSSSQLNIWRQFCGSQPYEKDGFDSDLVVEVLGGDAEAEALFMLGESAKTCLRIAKNTAKQNRALLGYACQGNVRLVVLRTQRGRILGRAILRVLLRQETVLTDSSALPTHERALNSLCTLFARSCKYREDPTRISLSSVLDGLSDVTRTDDDDYDDTQQSHVVLEEPVIWMERAYFDESSVDADSKIQVASALQLIAATLAEEMGIPLLRIENVKESVFELAELAYSLTSGHALGLAEPALKNKMLDLIPEPPLIDRFCGLESNSGFQVRSSGLIEVDGLAPFVYSDGALASRNENVLRRGGNNCKKAKRSRVNAVQETPENPGQSSGDERLLVICRYPRVVLHH